jgi:peptidyl-dipeptidase A
MAPTSPSGTREQQFAAFVDSLVGRLQPLEREHNAEYWLLATTGEESHLQACSRLDSQIRLIHAERAPYEFLRGLAAGGPLADPLLQRQLKLLLDAFRARQLPPEMIERQVVLEKRLESTFTNHRAELDGEAVSDNHILEVLARSDESDLRRRAWEASKRVGERVEAELLELVRLRNEGARQLGFPNFFTMGLELDELDEAELFALLAELEHGTQPLWDAYKRDLDARLAARFGIAPEVLMPWHYADPFFQQAPAAQVDLDRFYAREDLEAITRRYFAAVGLEVDELMVLADLHERPGKSQHAFCLNIDRGREIRVLCNNQPTEKWMGTMLHEFGHAAYDRFLDPSLPWLLRSQAHILTTEASAMLFGRLSRNPAWIRRWTNADPAALAREGEGAARAVRRQLLVQTRWELVMIHMERALYGDPGQDLCARWWSLVERFQGVRRPPGRHAPDWAAKVHFSVAPVYYQNYLLGEMLASQLQAHLLEHVIGGDGDRWERYVASPAVGEFLRSAYYAHGRRWNWRELVSRATGRPLDSGPFVADLAGGAAPA